MRIKDLINTLKQFPPECEIKHLDCEYGTSEPVVELYPKRNIYWIREGEHIEDEDD